MTDKTFDSPDGTAAGLAEEQLTQIRERNEHLAAQPWVLHSDDVDSDLGKLFQAAIGDVRDLLVELAAATERAEKAVAILARVTSRMDEYDRYGSRMVNVRQVLNLLSPTWPDGNYEEPA